MSHPITEAMRQITLQAIRQKGITKQQISEATGNGKTWATKFLDGTLKTIKDDALFAVEELLGINYFTIERVTGTRSPLASKIAALVDADPAFAKLAAALEEALTKAHGAFASKYIPTQDMTKVGQQIITICFANEDKPGKVARLVLELLSK